MSLNKKYLKATDNEKSQLKQELLEKVEERRILLLELMENHPADVLQVAIPEKQQVTMPEEIVRLLEQPTELEGELEVFYEDYSDNKHKLRHFLKTSAGENFELYFADLHLGLQSGSRVRAKGLLLGEVSTTTESGNSAMVLKSTESSIVFMDCCDSTTSEGTSTPEISNAYGEKQALVFLVNFQDKTDQPWTKEETQHVFFNETSDFFRENSSGQTWLTGNVVGWYTLPISSTICDQSAILTYAHEAAQNAGVNISGYDRYVYVFPKNACPWAGRAQVGGGSTPAWLNGYMQLKLTSHELGHNFGLGHSKSLDCDSGTIEGFCFTRGYGDTLDTMGNYYSGHYTAFHKERLGWLGYNSMPEIVTVESTGTYVLSPYSSNDLGPKALKVLKSIDASTGRKTWYYIEYRVAQGFDGFISDPESVYVNGQNILNGVVVHLATEGDYDSSQLLDMTPESDPSNDFADPALVVSESFSDSDAGLTITTNSVDGTQASVTVSFGDQPCVPSNPTLNITPSVSSWVEAGTSVNYDVTLTNNDSTTCPISTFNLSTTIPSGWTGLFSNSEFNLAAGESLSTALTVTSSNTAIDGYYEIDIIATNGSYSASGTVTYVVENSTVTNSAPVANHDSATTSVNTAVVINVLSNDSDPDGDSLSVSSVSGVSGNAKVNSDGSITFTPISGFVGTESFSYTISDANGGSATANVVVTIIDNTNPTVTLTSPSSGETVSGTITIQAASSDNISVAKVEFRVNGSLFSSDTSSPYSVSLDTTTLTNGLHKISTQAIDTSGNMSALSEITITVDNSTLDTTAPTVTITNPADGAVVSAKSTITIAASAVDDVKVSRVDFYVNGSIVCSDTTLNYTCSYNIPGGKGKTYVIEGRAIDSSGNEASHKIQVTAGDSTTDGGGSDSGVGSGSNNGKGNKK